MRRPALMICFLFITGSILAQENNLSLQFNRILFRDLADTIEKVIPVKIYYSREWVDTLKLKISPGEKTVTDLFNKSLKNTGFSFFVADNNRLIITKGFIKTNFSDEYANYLKYRVNLTDSVKYSGSSVTLQR
jgi:hypothetical protein